MVQKCNKNDDDQVVLYTVSRFWIVCPGVAAKNRGKGKVANE